MTATSQTRSVTRRKNTNDAGSYITIFGFVLGVDRDTRRKLLHKVSLAVEPAYKRENAAVGPSPGLDPAHGLGPNPCQVARS